MASGSSYYKRPKEETPKGRFERPKGARSTTRSNPVPASQPNIPEEDRWLDQQFQLDDDFVIDNVKSEPTHPFSWRDFSMGIVVGTTWVLLAVLLPRLWPVVSLVAVSIYNFLSGEQLGRFLTALLTLIGIVGAIAGLNWFKRSKTP